MIALDTHAWIWLINEPDRLGAAARNAVKRHRRSRDAFLISSISTWEIYMLAAKKRLVMAMAPEIWISRCEQLSFLRFCPVDTIIARISVTACTGLHGDPADRFIVATALQHGASLITCDKKIHRSGLVKCIW